MYNRLDVHRKSHIETKGLKQLEKEKDVMQVTRKSQSILIFLINVSSYPLCHDISRH